MSRLASWTLAAPQALGSAAGYTVNEGGSLVIDNTSANITGRVNSSAGITLNAGTLSFVSNATGTNTASVGTITLGPGTSIINSTDTAGGGTAALTINSLIRAAAGETVNFSGTTTALSTSGGNQIKFTNAPTTFTTNQGKVIPFATETDTATTFNVADLVGTTAPFNVESLTAAGFTYATSVLTANANGLDVVKPSSALAGSPTANTTIAALFLNGSFASTLSAGVTLNIQSGVILDTGASTISGGTALNFGTAEGIISDASGATTTISTTPITGTGGLTAASVGASAGTLTFSGTTGNPNLSGTASLDGGTLTVANGGDLGTGTLQLANGTLAPSAATNINNPVSLNGAVTIGSGTNIAVTFHGAVTMAGNSTIINGGTSNASVVTFDGAIGDGGSNYTLSIGGTTTATTVALNNINTYGGGTVLAMLGVAPVLSLGNSNALGTGTLTIQSATPTIVSTVAVTLPNAVTLDPGVNVTFSANSNPITFASAVTLTGTATITATATGGIYFNGGIAGATAQNSGALTLTGAGIVLLPAASTYADGTTITSTGTISVGSNTSFGTGPLTLTGGAAASTTTLVATSTVAMSNFLTLNPLNTTGSFTFTGSNMTFSGVTTLANTAASILTFNNSTTFSGPISGAATTALTLAGTGTLTLSGANTFTNTATAGLTLNMTSATFAGYLGTLVLGNYTALGATANAVTLTAGNLQASGSSTIFVGNALTITASANIGFTGSQSLTFTGAATTASGTNLFTNNLAAAGLASVSVTAAGTGYSLAPSVTLTGGGGAGAAASSTLKVTGSNVSAAGSGYTIAPSVSLNGGGGTGATATSSSAINTVVVGSGGSGYTSMPTISSFGAGGSSVLYTVTGAVNTISYTDLGNYYYQPQVTITGGGASSSATATVSANVSTGYFSGISANIYGDGGYTQNLSNVPLTFTNGLGVGGVAATGYFNTDSFGNVTMYLSTQGSGYTSAPTVTAVDPNNSDSTAFTVALLDVGNVTPATGGSGYTSLPTITLIEGNPTAATSYQGFSTGNQSLSSKLTVTAVNVTNGGSGFTGTGVTFNNSGTGFTATATASDTLAVTALTITAAGSGYTSMPTVQFDLANVSGGSGAVATVTGGVNTVTLTSAGTYATLPSVSFSGGGGTLAAATAVGNFNTVTFSGGIGAGVSTTNFMGTGTTVLTNVNAMAGTVNINGGILDLNSAGTLAATAYTVDNGGTLLLDNTATATTHRLGASTNPTLALNGGNFRILGNSSTAVAETSTNALTLGAGSIGGASTYLSVDQGANVAVSFSTMTRSAGSGATIDFQDTGSTGTNTLGNASGTNKITFTTTAPATTPSSGLTAILPYATYNGASDFATYNSTFGIVGYLKNGGTYVSAVTGAAATANVQKTANETVSTSTTINSLSFSGGGTISLTIASGVTLTVTSGAILTTGSTTVTITGGGMLALGEGIIQTASGSSLTINSSNASSIATLFPILTATNVTFSGAGSVTLDSPTSIATSTALNSGTLIVNNPLAVGGTLILNGGTLQTALSGGLDLTNALTLGNSNITLGNNGNPLVFTGVPTLSGNQVTLNTPTSSDASTFTGIMTGTVIYLNKSGNGTLYLTGSNNFAGVVNINNGTVNAQQNLALGTNANPAVIANGAMLQMQGTMTGLTKPLVLNGGTGLQWVSGATAVESNAILLQANTTINVPGGGVPGTSALSLSGIISGPGGITKTGNGQLTLSAQHVFWPHGHQCGRGRSHHFCHGPGRHYRRRHGQ